MMIDESMDYKSIDYKSLPSEEQMSLAVQMYIESHADPNVRPMSQTEIGKLFGHSQQWVSAALINSGVLDRIEKRTRSNVILARALMQTAAPKIAEETIKSALKKRDKKFEYVTQQDRRDVLDRAGVRAEKEEAQAVTISFAGGSFDVGMPEGK